MKKGNPKTLDVFFKKNLNDSFQTSRSNETQSNDGEMDLNPKQGQLKKQKSSRTIMQQINSFALTPMNDNIAAATIEDHKYLLELVENRCAIAYFAAVNRNQSLFFALKLFHQESARKKQEAIDWGEDVAKDNEFLETTFNNVINEFDFMSVIMYPELANRRQFVHDCWIIAKGKENQEFKIAVSRDPYFYLNREDLLVLLYTHDDVTIKHLLELHVKIHLDCDISYKLVAIKDVQVDKNQMCPLKLTDFVSVLLMNKRKDNFNLKSDILFNHNYILKFLKRHRKLVIPHEILLILIMSNKFRLSLHVLQSMQVPFQIEFFTSAIQYNSYDVAFYLLKVYEDDIQQNIVAAVDAHIQAYKLDRQFLKSKLYMSKLLLNEFNFNQARNFLDAIYFALHDHSLEGNLFAHSSNPLLAMCQLYELLLKLMHKFLSLKKNCETLMEKTMEMAIRYIGCIDDENYLNTIMLERDFESRDVLKIAVDLELLNLIQAPKVQAIIKGIYFSPFEQSGNIFRMSTNFQIVFGNKIVRPDIESEYRFLKERNIEEEQQSQWQFEVFKSSMNSKIQASTIVSIIFAVITIYQQIRVVESLNLIRPVTAQIYAFREDMFISHNATLINQQMELSHELFDSIEPDIKKVHSAMSTIVFLSAMNFFYILEHIQVFMFTNKIRRQYVFPDVLHMTDLVLAVCSINLIFFITQNIFSSVGDHASSKDIHYQMSFNLEYHKDYNLEYLFAVVSLCLIMRIAVNLQFIETIGPLIKIISKMSQDFLNFCILYVVLLVMFSLLGNINFYLSLEEYDGFLASMFTIIDASIGNYSLDVFEGVKDESKRVMGQLFMIVVVLSFQIVMFNLAISVLSQTYSMFENRSNGLFLKKILSKRDEVLHDEFCGTFMVNLAPLNSYQFLYAPLAYFMPYGSPQLKQWDSFFLKVQYCIFMQIFFGFFIVASLVLLPLAYVISIFDKIGDKRESASEGKGAKVAIFIIFGLPILALDFLWDLWYFWVNSFQTNLNKIIIIKEKSEITNKTLREISIVAKQFIEHKIKSITLASMIKLFRLQFKVQSHIQYLMFGQFIPKGGFKQNRDQNKLQTLKSMKTERLFKEREEELKKMSDNLQFIESKNQLIQFNQLKKLFHCFVFKQHERQILCSSIMLHIMDEMRKDRKIKMILKDRGIEDYVNLDITDIDLDAVEDLEEFDLPTRAAIQEKLDFRKRLAQRASLTKLNYYAVMMRKVFGFASIPAPESFTDKLKNLQKNSAIAGVKRADSNKSFFSMVSRTNMSEKKDGEEDEEEYGGEGSSGFEDDDDMVMSQDGQMKKKVNPVLQAFGDLFGDLNSEIKDYATKRYTHLVKVMGGEVKKDSESEFDEFRGTMTSGQLVMTDFD